MTDAIGVHRPPTLDEVRERQSRLYINPNKLASTRRFLEPVRDMLSHLLLALRDPRCRFDAPASDRRRYEIDLAGWYAELDLMSEMADRVVFGKPIETLQYATRRPTAEEAEDALTDEAACANFYPRQLFNLFKVAKEVSASYVFEPSEWVCTAEYQLHDQFDDEPPAQLVPADPAAVALQARATMTVRKTQDDEYDLFNAEDEEDDRCVHDQENDDEAGPSTTAASVEADPFETASAGSAKTAIAIANMIDFYYCSAMASASHTKALTEPTDVVRVVPVKLERARLALTAMLRSWALYASSKTRLMEIRSRAVHLDLDDEAGASFCDRDDVFDYKLHICRAELFVERILTELNQAVDASNQSGSARVARLHCRGLQDLFEDVTSDDFPLETLRFESNAARCAEKATSCPHKVCVADIPPTRTIVGQKRASERDSSQKPSSLSRFF